MGDSKLVVKLTDKRLSGWVVVGDTVVGFRIVLEVDGTEPISKKDFNECMMER